MSDQLDVQKGAIFDSFFTGFLDTIVRYSENSIKERKMILMVESKVRSFIVENYTSFYKNTILRILDGNSN